VKLKNVIAGLCISHCIMSEEISKTPGNPQKMQKNAITLPEITEFAPIKNTCAAHLPGHQQCPMVV